MQGETARATIVNFQKKSLVIELYSPYSIVQVSEVLTDLTVRRGTRDAYVGKAVVVAMVNTGLTALVSLTLTERWNALDEAAPPAGIGARAAAFVQDWSERFRIGRDYQVVVNETRAFLSEMARWLEQVDLSDALPRQQQRLRPDVFFELAAPLMAKMKFHFDCFNDEAARVDAEFAPSHRAFTQAALHPLILRAPFVFRTYTKPLGYAGDYQMVNQILGDPREGPSTYFQVVNTAFLQTAVAAAHRHRIDILVQFLVRLAETARLAGGRCRVLNVGCGPAAEIQRFLETYPHPELLSFELVDFSDETLAWTRATLDAIVARIGKPVVIDYVHDSVHQLIKRRAGAATDADGFDAVYCAGLFDYLSDKVCARLTAHFAARTRAGGTLLVTNVHVANPEKFSMEHVLEWYLIYRNEAQMAAILPARCVAPRLYTDPTGVNVFAEARIAQPAP